MNDLCYRFHAINFTKGILDDCIDATYIIYLEGNGRLEHIYEQLNTFHPSKKVFILFNKGYKKCTKQKHIDKPPLDLVDAFLTVIQDAQNKKYNNILILEDDFIFHNDFLEPSHNKHIIEFVNNNKEKEIVYHLSVQIHTHNGNRLFENPSKKIIDDQLVLSSHPHPYQEGFVILVRDIIKTKKRKMQSGKWGL